MLAAWLVNKHKQTLCMQLRGEDRTSVTDLQNLLKQTAEVYRSLVQHAKAASVPVPSEAQLGTGVKRGPDELEYDEFAAANATDWDDFQDEGEPLGAFSGLIEDVILCLMWFCTCWVTFWLRHACGMPGTIKGHSEHICRPRYQRHCLMHL